MTTPNFYIVDVFAEEKYAGNQLAVFRNAQGLSDKEMQKIAREMNFSETTFILSDDERDRLKKFLAEMGHDDVKMVHPYDTLSSLFMRIIDAERRRAGATRRD